MGTYICLVRYTEQGIKTIKQSPARFDAGKDVLKGWGGEVKACYLTMGDYDFVVIIEAPTDDVAARWILNTASAGNVRTTTLKAFSEADYKAIVAALPQGR
jgi:uncharacterized protein with GYD domain